MVTKLTLTVDAGLIDAAKEYAHLSNRSLSKIVEDYLRSIVEDKKGTTLSAKLKRIHGAVKLPKGFDEKTEIRKSLQKKHL